ncbi:hypothetical protein INF35_04820 [Subdoligranulum sp. DSM 109015]|uniref:Secreted protein n=1 Tax=Gemmiger gallinarum TaxID=2779354 RepID=A0ABR9R1X2_9FIRM|nr:hypothetical protein [Gemmiger gallinarum]
MYTYVFFYLFIAADFLPIFVLFVQFRQLIHFVCRMVRQFFFGTHSPLAFTAQQISKVFTPTLFADFSFAVFFSHPTVFSLSQTGSSLFREPCSPNQRKIYYIYLLFQRAGHIQQIPGNLFLCIADILYTGSFQQKWFFRVFIKHNFSIMVVCQAGTFALDRSGSFFTGFIKESFFFFLSSRCVFMHWIFLFFSTCLPGHCI